MTCGFNLKVPISTTLYHYMIFKDLSIRVNMSKPLEFNNKLSERIYGDYMFPQVAGNENLIKSFKY